MNIKRYSICSAETPGELVTIVTRAANEGWLPIGGVAVAEGEEPPAGRVKPKLMPRAFLQAMVMPVRPEDIMGQIVTKANGG